MLYNQVFIVCEQAQGFHGQGQKSESGKRRDINARKFG
jgi:hypothetical protein